MELFDKSVFSFLIRLRKYNFFEIFFNVDKIIVIPTAKLNVLINSFQKRLLKRYLIFIINLYLHYRDK